MLRTIGEQTMNKFDELMLNYGRIKGHAYTISETLIKLQTDSNPNNLLQIIYANHLLDSAKSIIELIEELKKEAINNEHKQS